MIILSTVEILGLLTFVYFLGATSEFIRHQFFNKKKHDLPKQ